MIGLALTRWILQQALRRPLVLGCAAALVVFGFLLDDLVALGVATEAHDLPALALESAFLGGVLGTGLAAAFLARVDRELVVLSPVRRALTEGAPLLLIGAAAQLLVLVGPVAVHGAHVLHAGDAGTAAGWGQLVWTQVHLALLALVLLRTPLSPGAVPIVLVLLVWPAASVLQGVGDWGAAAAAFVDPAPHLAAVRRGGETAVDPVARVGLPLVLALVALAATRPHPRRGGGLHGDRFGGRRSA